jgi:hypothetical protein
MLMNFPSRVSRFDSKTKEVRGESTAKLQNWSRIGGFQSTGCPSRGYIICRCSFKRKQTSTLGEQSPSYKSTVLMFGIHFQLLLV